MRRSILVAPLAILLPALLSPARSALAGDSVKSLVADATALSKKDPAGAAGKFGDAIAAAHKSGNLLAEQQVIEPLEEFVKRLRVEDMGAAGPSAPQGTAGRRRVMALVMHKLEPSRNGAFVSAHVLARNLLYLATEKGDGGLVEEASAVLVSREKFRNAGRATGLLAAYAAGMKAVAAKDDAGAQTPLQKTMDGAVAAGWATLAVRAGTELAAARVRLKDMAGARAALDAVGVLCLKPETPFQDINEWGKMLTVRLGPDPGDLLDPWRKAVEARGGGESGGAGAPGAPGKPGGRPALSALGVAFPRIPSTGPVAVVTRTPAGFEIREPWDKAFKATRPIGDMVRYFEDRGLFLAFHGPSVAVEEIDLPGNNAVDADGNSDISVRAFYDLAAGEAWTLGKDGVVAVGPAPK